MKLANGRLLPLTMLTLCLTGCGGAPESGIAFPQLTGSLANPAAEEVPCGDTPVWSALASEEGVEGVRCWVARDVEPVGGPADLLAAVSDALMTANSGAQSLESGCTQQVPKYVHAYQTCDAWLSLPGDDARRALISIYTEVTGEDLEAIIEIQQREGELSDSDFEGVEATAWIAVSWGTPSSDAS